ncbi:MAG: hypothetical protein JSV89_09490 [Spirochaetaceae bacterium]|nr:MAG: hypothetical protein JSV89_09490 [Spirochaetaceae bacterium]
MDDYDEPEEEQLRRYQKRRKSAEASLTSGIVFTIAFGIAWSVTGLWFFIFPLLFAGVMPMVEGIRRLAAARYAKPIAAQPQKPSIASVEKQILLAAKEENGVVTPALIALKTDLSIQEAEKKLDELAQNGYTVMQVRESGRIEYEFPEFMPRLGDNAGETI